MVDLGIHLLGSERQPRLWGCHYRLMAWTKLIWKTHGTLRHLLL